LDSTRVPGSGATARRVNPIDTCSPAGWLGGSGLTRSTVADSGYADQAHLIREFHQFTGASPTAFLAHPQTQTAVPPPA
jgi:hypothetical protein